jgi:hypothetical protein
VFAGKLIVKYLKLSGFITILGIVFVAIYFAVFLWAGAFFGLMLPCYVIIGIIEMNISEKELMMKHSKLFGFIAVLGAVFVTTFSTVLYLSYTTDLGEILSSVWSSPFLSLLFNALMFFLLIGGTVFVTVGVLGVGTRYFKNHRNQFAVPTAVLVPLFIFALISLLMSSTPLTVGF